MQGLFELFLSGVCHQSGPYVESKEQINKDMRGGCDN